jgi:hypothetical protein
VGGLDSPHIRHLSTESNRFGTSVRVQRLVRGHKGRTTNMAVKAKKKAAKKATKKPAKKKKR